MRLSIKEIANRMGRHKSTIYRELDRNLHYGYYMPAKADEQAKARHPKPPNKIDANTALNNYVVTGLKQGWSPEQISGRMKMEGKEFYACSESIYRYIYNNRYLGLYKFLPSKKIKRRCRSKRNGRVNQIQIAIRNIHKRPAYIKDREELGHWEGDTVRFSKDQKSCVTTLVERKSRYVCLNKNADKKAKTVTEHICDKMKLAPKKLWRSIAFDQGSEFMEFRAIERQTKATIYFCDTSSPWQRGSNENTNGRLRRYLPRGLEIDGIPQEYLDKISNLMNNTPRKCLGFQTPAEVIKQHWNGFCRTSL